MNEKMKTRILIIILTGVIISGTMTCLYSQMHECLYPSIGVKRIPYDFSTCWELFVNGYLPYSSETTSDS